MVPAIRDHLPDSECRQLCVSQVLQTPYGPGGCLLPVLTDQRSRIEIRDYPRSRPDLNGTGLTVHPVLVGLDRASCPIIPNPPGCSALKSSPR
jgi:hypothetical protein